MNNKKLKTIDLRKLANDPRSEVHPMLRELERAMETERSSGPRWAARFIAAGKTTRGRR